MKYGEHTTQSTSGGFTYVEVMVVIGIFAFVLVIFLNIFDWSTENYSYQEANVRVTTSARQSMADLQTSTLQASRVLASRVFGGTLYSSGSSTMVLELPAINSSGDVLGNTWDYVVFYVASNSLYRLADINAASFRELPSKLLSDNVDSLNFSYNHADFAEVSSVTVSLTTGISTPGQVVRTSVEQALYLRNK